MTLYAVKDDRRQEATRDDIRSWSVHLAVAVAATAVAILVLVLNGVAEHEPMPRMLQNAFAVAAATAWTLYYIKRAEAKILSAIRRERKEGEDRIAALGVMVSDCRREQSEVAKLLGERRGEVFAEGWLACSGENPEIETEQEPPGHNTLALKVVR